MSYDIEIINKIDKCFEEELNRRKNYIDDVSSIFKSIIEIFETSDETKIERSYTNIFEYNDETKTKEENTEVETVVVVSMPISDSFYSQIRPLFEVVYKEKDLFSSEPDYIPDDLEKKNIAEAKKRLYFKFDEYFSKYNFIYYDERIHILPDRKTLEIRLKKIRKYSDMIKKEEISRDKRN